MIYISSEEINSIGITPDQCVDWVREAFLIKNESVLPAKISIHPQGTDFINTMPCLLPERYHLFGCKIVSRIKGTQPSLKSEMFVMDSVTGSMIAMLDGNWITANRTGAVAALSINTLRNTHSKIYSFIGLGVIGQAALDCFLASNSDSQLTVRLKRYKDHAENTVNKFRNHTNVSFEIVDTMSELVDGADVVVSCITEADGLLVPDVSLFKPGVLVIPVHTRGFQNCDKEFDRIIADDKGHVKDFRYFNDFKEFGELSDVLSGEIAGRENDYERILSYNIGLGLHDIYFASKILHLLAIS